MDRANQRFDTDLRVFGRAPVSALAISTVVLCLRRYDISLPHMKKLLVMFLLASFSQWVLADDCDFDQKTRVKENIELKTKYPGSRLVEGNLVLVVPVQEGEVRINIGGCVHYGVGIELRTRNPSKYRSEEQFMNEILRLAKVYSQGQIDDAKLRNIVKHRNWMRLEAPNRYYLFNYDEISVFEVYEKEEGPNTVIGLNYYN